MTERTVTLTENVRQTCTHIDLDYLKRFRKQIAEDDIECVRPDDVVERNIRHKHVPLLLKCQAIAAEPIIVDVFQKSLGRNRVRNG